MENLSGDGGVRVILILGSTGYIARAFTNEAMKRKLDFIVASRPGCDYTKPPDMDFLLRKGKPSLVINCAAFIPQPSVDLCKNSKDTTILANLVFPTMLATLCGQHDVPLAHISTACLYDDAKIYCEQDAPTRDWDGYCGFYLRTKYLSELAVRQWKKSYVWRIRLPFDHRDSPRNYLSKLRAFKTVWNVVNSLTHRGDFVKAALDMWAMRAPWGTYSMTNPGFISAEDVVERMNINPRPEISIGLAQGCKLSTAKLISTGVKIRPVSEALDESVREWLPEKS